MMVVTYLPSDSDWPVKNEFMISVHFQVDSASITKTHLHSFLLQLLAICEIILSLTEVNVLERACGGTIWGSVSSSCPRYISSVEKEHRCL